MLKAYNQVEELDKETLASDEEFLSDAYMFLQEREGVKGVLSPEEVYDRFMEHMRFHDTNEVTTIRDLEYAQNASLEGKQNFARLIDAYDKVDADMSWKMVGDYAEAIARAPSTYVGLISGGTGKAAAVATTQAAKLGIRKLLSNAASSAIGRAAIAEGAIGTVQGGLGEATRVTTGAQDEFTGVRTAVSGVGNAIGAGILTGGLNALGSRRAAKAIEKGTGGKLKSEILNRDFRQREADELLAKSELAEAARAKKASEATKTVLKNTSSEKIKKLKEQINAINPNIVAMGRKLKKDRMPGETMEAALGSEVTENIMAAAIQVMEKLNVKEGEPITEAVSRMMRRGDMGEISSVSKIMDEHNITLDQFSYIYAAELSEAGRKLQQSGQIKKVFNEFKRRKMMSVEELAVDNLMRDMDELNQIGYSSISREQAVELTDVLDKSKTREFIDKVFKGAQDLDRMGIGFMTAQPATTMRNNQGGLFRTAIDATTRVMDNAVEKAGFIRGGIIDQKKFVQRKLIQEYGIEQANDIMRQAETNPDVLKSLFDKYGKSAQQGKSIFSGAGDTSQYLLNQAEARMIRQLFKKNFPSEAERLFREQADLASTVGKESPMAWAGRKINILNTASDNFFKQGILAASIKRRLSDQGISLNEVIKDGRFGSIPDDILKASIKDAYEFTYQSGFQGADLGSRVARFGIELQQKVPFVISAFMPFPRFVANQLKFQHDHMPIIGMVIPAFKGRDAMREALPKQMAGVAIMSAALAWRAKQGEDAEWFEIKKSDDYYINGKAIYGPIAPFMVVADMMYRGFSNTPFPEDYIKYYSKALAEATLGSTFRTGLGLQLLDKALNDDILSGDKVGLKVLADVMGRYTIPGGVAKDIYSQFDPQSRLVPATNTGKMEEPWFEYVYKVATRNLPDLPLASWTDDTLATRDYDEPAVSPFRTGPLKAINPIEKQLFGFTTVRKNKLEKEMSRLGLMYNDLYKRPTDDRIDFYTRQELSRGGPNSKNMNRELIAIINSPEYKEAGPAFQKNKLQETAAKIKTEAIKIARYRLDVEANRQGKPFSRTTLADWDSLSRNQQAQVNEIYRDPAGPYFGQNDIADDMEKTMQDADGNDVNVLVWAVDVGKRR